MDNFAFTLRTNKLLDLGFMGYRFTWCRGDPFCGGIAICLDRACATSRWSSMFPLAKVRHLPFYTLDHAPLLVDATHRSMPVFRHGILRFEQWWLEERDFCIYIRHIWTQNVVNQG